MALDDDLVFWDLGGGGCRAAAGHGAVGGDGAVVAGLLVRGQEVAVGVDGFGHGMGKAGGGGGGVGVDCGGCVGDWGGGAGGGDDKGYVGVGHADVGCWGCDGGAVAAEGVATDEGVVDVLGGVGGEVTDIAGESSCWEGCRSGGRNGGWPVDESSVWEGCRSGGWSGGWPVDYKGTGSTG